MKLLTSTGGAKNNTKRILWPKDVDVCQKCISTRHFKHVDQNWSFFEVHQTGDKQVNFAAGMMVAFRSSVGITSLLILPS
ncbi:hypothetical protein SLE2022_352190 [Rubroshorea leprosula]